jgi:predicted nucleic acid-binding protein
MKLHLPTENSVIRLHTLRINRYPHFVLLPRIGQLRHKLSAYDAAYVALATRTRCNLLTSDARLVSASGQTARIHVL